MRPEGLNSFFDKKTHHRNTTCTRCFLGENTGVSSERCLCSTVDSGGSSRRSKGNMLLLELGTGLESIVQIGAKA